MGNGQSRVGYSETNGEVSAFSMLGRETRMEDRQLIYVRKNRTIMAIFDGLEDAQCVDYVRAGFIKYFEDLSDSAYMRLSENELASVAYTIDNRVVYGASTCVMCIVTKRPTDYTILTMNIGDSKAFLVKPDARIVYLTTDHIPFREREADRIYEADGNINGDNTVESGIHVSRAFGSRFEKRAGSERTLGAYVCPELQSRMVVTVKPEFTYTIADPEDRLLLMSAGALDEVEIDNFKALLSQRVDVYELAMHAFEAGSRYNITLMLYKYDDTHPNKLTYRPGRGLFKKAAHKYFCNLCKITPEYGMFLHFKFLEAMENQTSHEVQLMHQLANMAKSENEYVDPPPVRHVFPEFTLLPNIEKYYDYRRL